MKTVCVDGYNIAMGRGTGIATYGRNLLINARSLGLGTQVLYGPPARTGRDNTLNEIALVESDAGPRKVRKSERFWRTLTSRLGRTATSVRPSGEVIWPSSGGGRPATDGFWAAQDLFFYAQRGFKVWGGETPVSFAASPQAPAPDLMHWTAVLPMYARGVPNLYTIHDLIPLRLPHTTADDKAAYMAMCRNIVRRADHIAVVSETTRQDVIRLLDVPEDRITNTYQAVDLPPHLTGRPQADVQLEIEGVFNLGWKEYFLHFGAIEPKKNLGRIVEAYLASGVQTPLVIVGGRSWMEEGEVALLNQVRRDDGPGARRIRQYEYMSLSLLISLIRGARGVLFPSLYEGFGLPVLEAMALDTAVLTSTAGSLPEVAGDAALMVDPYDTQAITRGVQALDADSDLRDGLAAKGRSQAARFSPQAYQARLGEVYGKLGLL